MKSSQKCADVLKNNKRNLLFSLSICAISKSFSLFVGIRSRWLQKCAIHKCNTLRQQKLGYIKHTKPSNSRNIRKKSKNFIANGNESIFIKTVFNSNYLCYVGINLIAEVPPKECTERVVCCDGGDPHLGHPKVYINLVNFCSNQCDGFRLYYLI